MSITPIFIFSLPRSGSTLVQRVLASHDGVATAAEPWILYPLLAARRGDLTTSDPWHRQLVSAIDDFVAPLPDGAADYDRRAREFALGLYERAADPGDRFFLDKSPPYHEIIDDIARTFPEAKLVFLWRNPLSVISSIVDTLCNGRWRVSFARADLFQGVDNLVRGYRRHADRAHAVRYEDLVRSPEAWRSLIEYVGLPFDEAALERFASVRLEGRMGDPTGVHLYGSLSAEPLVKWRGTIANPVRREWARRYVRWIGRDRLTTMGYDLDELLSDLAGTGVTNDKVRDDLRLLARGAVREMVRARDPGRPLISSFRALLSA